MLLYPILQMKALRFKNSILKEFLLQAPVEESFKWFPVDASELEKQLPLADLLKFPITIAKVRPTRIHTLAAPTALAAGPIRYICATINTDILYYTVF